MANQEHLQILKQGVDAWNAWRKEDDTRPQLSSADLSNTNLSKFNFFGADLSYADLRNANLELANIAHSRIIKANLHSAFLHGTLAIGTNFSGSTLTGACIRGWNIDCHTNLSDLKCGYVFLDCEFRIDIACKPSKCTFQLTQRRPRDSTAIFAPGEFAALVQKTLETIDLIFIDGIDWKAFFSSFQELRQQYGNDNLSIQSIERKGEAFVISLESSDVTNSATIEAQAKVLYEQQVKLLETQYRTQLDAKDKEIESHRRESADMMEITKLLASRPINVEAIAMADNQPKSTTYNLQGSKFGGGFAAEGGTQIGGTLNDYSVTIGNNLDDIDRLLNTISEMVTRFPEEQREEAQVELDDLAEEIKTPEKHNPTRFKKRLRGLLAAGTTAAALATGAANFSGDLNETAVNFGEFSDNVIELGERLGVTIEKEQPPQTP